MQPASEKDRIVLRRLAEQQAQIAALPVHQSTIQGWKKLNGLAKVRPMLWINEIPWPEMDVNAELTLQCEDEFCRQVEKELRQTIYQWNHMRGDMVVEGKFYSPLVIQNTGFGIDDQAEMLRIDERSLTVSRHYHGQIQSEADIEKIKMPQVTLDSEASEANYQRLVDVFGDLLKIEKRGAPGFWFSPWDKLIRWWGVQEAFRDLVDRPELVHHVMDHLLNAYMQQLDQYEQLGLLSLNNNNVRIGSGGLGYVDELPQPDFDPNHMRTIDLWGCATAQILGSVSPRMHDEFAVQYELRWLRRFGLNYYGCCEPLHRRLAMVEQVPNLRKISMSPWINVEEAVKNVGDRYVFSYKPNPAILAEDVWNPERARREMSELLQKAQGCVIEIIIKDISTVRYQPQRLWEWAHIVMELITA